MGFIAEAKRKNLWFGTEEKMEWFKTPSRGADTSPAGWDSEGTTLNGGGYVFNSFGSHKQYQFDWGSSNARVVAQKMKSYADGSYGRGYIYFVDPTIYDHNVLPAHWADPSMGIDYEGNSIVAGVDPVGVPTGANSNDLPVQAAQFNLNTVPVGFRGKAQAVYVPIPEGHTLSLGAMYSFTGSGGVFASPVLLTGAIAAPQKLTTLGVNTPNIVADTFSGVRGVWLWVGKTAAGNSTVTVHGLIGRLMTNAEATSYVIAENLLTNPNLVGDGTWAEVRRNHFTNPQVAVNTEGFLVAGIGSGGSVSRVLTTIEHPWAVRAENPSGVPSGGRLYTAITGLTVGQVVPIRVMVYAEASAGSWSLGVSEDTGNLNLVTLSEISVGEWREYRGSFTATQSTHYVQLRKISAGTGLDFVEATGFCTSSGPYFDGDTPDFSVDPDMRQRWLGAENASESVLEIERVAGVTALNCIAGVSVKHGQPAIRSITTSASNPASMIRFPVPSSARASGTLVASLTLDEPLTGTLNGNRLSVGGTAPYQPDAAPNEAGDHALRSHFTSLTSGFEAVLFHGALRGNPDVWWTGIGLFAGNYDGPAFSGSTPPNGETHYRWTGVIDNSTSEAYYVSSKSVEQKRGPWVGGMGHSGCRFVGKPTFIENGPDWTGFSATFKEVVN